MKKIFSLLFLFISLTGFSQRKWTTFRISEDKSPKNDISSIRFDREGNMWVATWYGIYKKEGQNWKIQGQENMYAQSLFIDKNNTKWAGFWDGGLRKSADGLEWEQVKGASPSNSVNVIGADTFGSVWVGDWSGGVSQQVKDGWKSYKSANSKLGDNSVLSVLGDAGGNMWIGTYHGLSFIEKSGGRLYDKKNSKLPDNEIYSLAKDKKGNLWIGTGNGLVKMTKNAWTVYNKGNSGLRSNMILSLATDEKGDIWVGTNKGVSVFNGVQWTTYTTVNSALPDDRVQTITIRGNKVYLGTSSGISVIE